MYVSNYNKYPEWTNLQRQKIDQGLPGTEGMRESGDTTKGYGASFWSDENILELDADEGCSTT